MPCPRGFKHQVVYPRPNRKRRVAEVPLVCPSEAADGKQAPHDGVATRLFSRSDEAWLQSVGICL